MMIGRIRLHKKIIALLLLVPLLILLLPLCSAAASENVTDRLTEDFKELIPEELSGLTDSDAVTEALGVESILYEMISAFTDEGGGVIGFFLLLLGLTLFMCIASSLPSASEICESGVCIASVAIILMPLYERVDYARECLMEAVEFFGGAIPVMIGISSASGSTVTATAQGATMSLVLSVVSGFCVKLLLPLAIFGGALGAFSCVGDIGASNLSLGVRNLFLWLTGIGSAVINGALALQTVIASSADTAAVRAARYSASSLIPIVGGTVSSALSTLSAGAAYLKSTVGATAVAVLLSVLLSPLVTLLLYRGAVSLAVTVSSFFGSDAGTRSLTAIRSALDSVCAVYSLCSLTFVIQAVLFMRGGAQV